MEYRASGARKSVWDVYATGGGAGTSSHGTDLASGTFASTSTTGWLVETFQVASRSSWTVQFRSHFGGQGSLTIDEVVIVKGMVPSFIG
jgi:hypothetical protein